jgi:hypothetical protein
VACCRPVDATSPYDGLSPADWKEVTEKLVDSYPVGREEIVEIVLGRWQSIFSSRIGRPALRIGRDLFPQPQILGYFLHELVPHEFQTRYPDVWRRDQAGADKDLVNLKNDRFSTEIKTSSNPTRVFGNRSYAQPGAVSRKSKAGFFLTINFQRWRDAEAGKLPEVTLIRLGWLDHTDWIGQTAATGQQARIRPEAYAGRLLELYRP